MGQLRDRPYAAGNVNSLHKAGAVRVVVSRIRRHFREFVDGDETLENSGHLVIELPITAAIRRRLFRMEAKQARSQGFDPEVDSGQQFLLLVLD